MKVVDYELFTVPPRWLFLKIRTDEGIAGWGEPVLEGRATTVQTAVEELMRDYVIGADPLEIERLWQMMYRGNHYRGGPVLMSAIAGIDQALWDIRGKAFDRPVYELLGGPVRDRVRVCQWISGDRPDEAAEAAAEAEERGYTAVEMMMNARPSRLETSNFVRMADERLRVVRETLDGSMDIAVDFRGRVSRSVAKQLLSVLDRYELMLISGAVAQLFTGTLADTYDPRAVLIALLAVSTVGLLLVSLVSFTPIVLLLVFIGLGCVLFGINPVRDSLITSITPSEYEGRTFGYVWTIALVISSVYPVVIGYLGDTIGLQASFTVLAIGTIGALGAVALLYSSHVYVDPESVADRDP